MRSPPIHLVPIAALCGLIAVLVAIASGAGVFLRGDLASMHIVTPRGEPVDVLLGGVYQWNSKNYASEGVGWDLVTLLGVLPAFVALLPALRRGSFRAALAVTGLLAYFLYQYFEYAVALAYGPFFLLYVAIFALSLSMIALLVSQMDVASLPSRFGDRFPRRSVIGLGIFMAVLLCGMWLPLVAKSFGGDVSDGKTLYGGTTLVVQAFDLGLLVPLGLFTALTVYLRQPVGFLLAGVVTVQRPSRCRPRSLRC